MFVYGVRCNPVSLPYGQIVTYIGGHNLVIFPSLTRPSSMQGSLNPRFWADVKRMVEAKRGESFEVDMEQPFIEDQKECEVLAALRSADPQVQPSWYYIPESNPQTAIIPESGPFSEVD